MADQRININIGTRYDGGGMASAVRGVNTVVKTTARAGAEMGKITSSIGVLGGVLGSMPGKIGNIASGLLGLGTALTGGPMAVISGVIMIASLAITWIRKMSTEMDDLAKDEADAHTKRMDRISEEEQAYKRVTDARKASLQSDTKTQANDLPATYTVKRAQLELDAANARASGDKEGERNAQRALADYDAMVEQDQLEAKRQAAEERKRIAEEELRNQQEIDRKLLDEQSRLKSQMDKLLATARGKVDRGSLQVLQTSAGAVYHDTRKTSEQYAKDVADAEAAAKQGEGYKQLADALAKVTARREANNGDSQRRTIAEASSDADAASAAIQAARLRADAKRTDMETGWRKLDETQAAAQRAKEEADAKQAADDAKFNAQQIDAIREAARKIREGLKGVGGASVTVNAPGGGGGAGGGNGGSNASSIGNQPLTDAARGVVGIGMRRDDTGYQYRTDANGNLTRMADSDRARRYAGRAERDARSEQMGPNLRAANDKRAKDIQGRLNDGRYVSDRDKDWLKRYTNFRGQESAEDPVVARLREIKTLLEQSLNIKQ